MKMLGAILLASALVTGCISVETRDEVFIDAQGARISVVLTLPRSCDMTAIKLSSSIGGAQTYLTDDTLPGLLVHENPADSGENHLITDILVVNPNATSITLWTSIQGPGIPGPTVKSQSDLVRIDVLPTAEGNEPRVFYTPFILEPGYGYYISTEILQGQEPSYLFGFVDTFPAAGVLGYGGLIRRADQAAIASIPAGSWITLDFEDGQVTNPVNVVQEPGNNRISLGAPGIWYVSGYGTFTADKQAGADRAIFTRFYNETDGAPITQQPFPSYIEDNSNNGLWSYTTMFEVPEALAGKYIRQEFGGSANAFANVVFHKLGMTFIRIAPTIGA